jgi:hypothetical protein
MNPELLKNTRRILTVAVVLLIAVLVYLGSTRNGEISIVLNDENMTLSYSSEDPVSIRYKDIISVTDTKMLEPGHYVSGAETKRFKFGVWENTSFGQYHLSIYANVDRYIVVKTANDIYVFNLESVDATDSFYTAFLDYIKTKQP